jgi:hypothetical protein
VFGRKSVRTEILHDYSGITEVDHFDNRRDGKRGSGIGIMALLG